MPSNTMSSTMEAPDRKVAAPLDVELLPGTEIMKDHGNIGFTHAGGKLDSSALVPHPTNNPSDPLNWSRRYKIAAVLSQLIVVWILVCGALSLAPMFPLLGAEFHIDEQQLSFLTGINLITFGFGNIAIVPLSNIFGRRPVSIICTLLVLLTNIWQALATSHRSIFAARACNGIVGSTSESITVQVIADIFFLHERGFWMVLYFTFYFSATFLGPIMSGNIAAHHGWRSFFWLAVALVSFAIVLLICGFPETKWQRPALTESREGLREEHTKAGGASIDQEVSKDINDNDFIGKGRPDKKQWLLGQKPDRRWISYVVRDVSTPFIIFFNPIIFWASLMLTAAANLLLLYNLTESSLLRSPPYGWKPAAVGYSNFAFFIGGVVGAITAGPFSDWLARRSTITNNGIREAEMRLPALIPYALVYAISHIVGAYGQERFWPWQTILIFGYGFSGLAVTSIPGISLAYAVDCFKSISGEIMTAATVMKNLLGFSLSYWIFKVGARDGWFDVFMIHFGVWMTPMLLTIPLYFYGKDLRRWTKDSKLHRMEAMI